MQRRERLKKASEVRSAISSLRKELKTASASRKAEIIEDLNAAYDDYSAFVDDSVWENPEPSYSFDEPSSFEDEDTIFEESPSYVAEPMFEDVDTFEESPSYVAEPMFEDEDTIFEESPSYVAEPMFEDVDTFEESPSYVAEPMFEDEFDRPTFSGPTYEVGIEETDFESPVEFYSKDHKMPMDASEQRSNLSSVEEENKQHVSYILAKVSDVVSAIEKYEQRQARANRPVRSAGARQRISSNMKALAKVVHNSNFKSASTKRALDNVGVNVMAMHKKLVKA